MDDRSKKEIEVLRRILFVADRVMLGDLRSAFLDELAGELKLGCELDQAAVDYIDWLLRRQEVL